MNIYSALSLVILSILLLALPRRLALLPIFFSLLYITRDQAVIIAGQHFYSSLILASVGILRLVIKREFYPRETDKITLSIVLWVAITIITHILLCGLNSDPSRIRINLTVMMDYFFCKSVVRSIDDIIAFLKLWPVILAPIALFMLRESLTRENIFSYLGGVLPDQIRDGRFRCQGPFGDCILAGTFGATIMPGFVALWFQKSYRKFWCVFGLIMSVIIIFTSVSSGALTTFSLEIIAFGFWYFRNQMHWVRRGLVAMIIGLGLIMKSSIWYLMSKLSDVAGGGGWHRARVLEVAFGTCFHEWWLIGTTYTRHWMPYGLSNDKTQCDITNQFLWEGVSGGFLSMALFIFIIVCCFRAIGNALHRNETAPFPHRVLLWALGVLLFGHVSSFMSVSYFDQNINWFFMIIGIIGAISAFPLLSAEN